MMAGDGIGALLRRLREEAGLTREEQAGLIEEAQGGRYFDPQNLKRWERESRLPERYWHPSSPARTACLPRRSPERWAPPGVGAAWTG